jgi:hypothetical protein
MVLLGIAALYLVSAWGMSLDPWLAAEPINSRTLPMLYGGALIVLTTAWLWARPSAPAFPGIRRPLSLVVVMMMFAWLVPRLSLWPAVPLLLSGALWIMGERRFRIVVALPCGIALLGAVLTSALGLYLPAPGWWP